MGEAKGNEMAYIDGFVSAVPTANKDKYLKHAKQGDALCLEFGALRVLECWGDDVPEGKLTDFRRAVQAKEDETVVLSWIEWPDKATRDAGMKKLMQDARMDPKTNPMPFDGKRTIIGGFAPVLELGAELEESQFAPSAKSETRERSAKSAPRH